MMGSNLKLTVKILEDRETITLDKYPKVIEKNKEFTYQYGCFT